MARGQHNRLVEVIFTQLRRANAHPAVLELGMAKEGERSGRAQVRKAERVPGLETSLMGSTLPAKQNGIVA